jgi:23S rRNA pseudouridine2604 synthase
MKQKALVGFDMPVVRVFLMPCPGILAQVAKASKGTLCSTVLQSPPFGSSHFVYLAFHKPVGIVCTTDTGVEKDNIIDFINYPKRIFPIGRLDKPSEGLIFLTNDGDIVNKILRARNHHEKEYIVSVDKPINADFVIAMSNGVPILDTITRKCKVEPIDKFTFKIILTQGLNRQIRRMCDYLGYNVTRLKRVRIMNVKLDIPVGKWRYITDAELSEIKRLVAESTKTHEA